MENKLAEQIKEKVKELNALIKEAEQEGLIIRLAACEHVGSFGVNGNDKIQLEIVLRL